MVTQAGIRLRADLAPCSSSAGMTTLVSPLRLLDHEASTSAAPPSIVASLYPRSGVPLSRPARTAQDMRDCREERGRLEVDVLAPLHLQAGALDGAGGVPREMAAAGDARPEDRIQQPLQPGHARLPGHHVLIEAELATGAEDPDRLRQHLLLVGDRAEHQGHHNRVEGAVSGR